MVVPAPRRQLAALRRQLCPGCGGAAAAASAAEAVQPGAERDEAALRADILRRKPFFDTFGYLHLPGLLSDRIADVEAEFEALWESAVSMDLQDNAAAVPRRGQVMYAGELSTSSKCITAFIDRSPRLASLLDDPRVRALGAALLGDDWSFTGSDGNLYRGTTGWHR